MKFSIKVIAIFGTFCILNLIPEITSEVVCSEDELVKELVEDIEDNGKFYILSLRHEFMVNFLHNMYIFFFR